LLLEPPVLGELFRHLQAFQSLFEAEGIDCLTGPDGDLYCLADILRLRELSRHLDPAQVMAIECLYMDMADADAARLMNAEAHQVSEYAYDGLRQLCAIFEPEEGLTSQPLAGSQRQPVPPADLTLNMVH